MPLLRTRHRATSGFTLIELMIVVAIIGVLSAVAIPAFMQYIRKSKTTEAYLNVRRAYESSRSYMFGENVARGSTNTIDLQFPEPHAPTPLVTCCASPGGKCPPAPGQWESPTWQALTFSVGDPHYYRYVYESTGSIAPGPGSSFTIRALGDLDCDGIESTFESIGVLNAAQRDIEGQAGMYVNLELE